MSEYKSPSSSSKITYFSYNTNDTNRMRQLLEKKTENETKKKLRA